MSEDEVVRILAESASPDLASAEVADAGGTHTSDASNALRRALRHRFVQRRPARNAHNQPTFRWRVTARGLDYLNELDAEDWSEV